MKLTNTVCLAALVLACPLATSTVSGAIYDKHYNAITEGETIKSSGYKETPTGEWYTVYIGHAEGKVVQGNNNEGILGEGLKLSMAYGAWVYGDNAQANTNNIVLKKGVVFNGDNSNFVYGGHVVRTNEGEASHNTVTFEKYFDGNVTSVYGGDITLNGEDEGNASASDNTVTINEGFDGAISYISVGIVNSYGSGAERSITASDNNLYITKPAKASLLDLAIGVANHASLSSEEKENVDVYANNNYGELVLNDNTLINNLTVARASSRKGKAEASGNSLYLTGGIIGSDGSSANLTVAGAYSEGENAGATVNNNTLVLTDVKAAYVNSFSVGTARSHCNTCK